VSETSAVSVTPTETSGEIIEPSETSAQDETSVPNESVAPAGDIAASPDSEPVVPNLVLDKTGLDYTLFCGSLTENFQMHCATGIVTGDIYSGNSFCFAGSSLDINGSADTVLTVESTGSDISIDAENENITVISMPDLGAIIEEKAAGYTAYDKSMTFKKGDTFSNTSMKTEGSFKFNNSTLTGQCYVIAKEDISLGINTANVQQADQLVIYSQDGDITINGPDFVMNGILYAPNGTVKITSSTYTLNGRIIADRIELNCNQFTVAGTLEDLNLINDAPLVEAGQDTETYLSDLLPLNGAVRDDSFLLSLPETTWEVISGPGTVTFGDPKAAVTTASFSVPGTYELKLKAFDGLLESSDTIVVVVLDNAVYKTYTTQEDFQEGTLVNAVTDESSLQIDGTANVLDFMWVANSSKGTVMKINTRTCEIVGEFKTSPSGQPSNPSRTTVDHEGSVWVANRDGSSVIKIGLAENGGWIDKNGNGKCDTSIGLGNILAWSNAGGADTLGGTATAADECILLYVKVPSSGTRHISVDKDNNVWVSGTGSRTFVLLDGETGAILRTEKSVGYGGYGGLIDENGVIWSANRLLRWDTSKPLSGANGVNWKGYSANSYGLAIDSQGNVWNTSNGSGSKISKYSPDGTLIGTFNQGNYHAQGCAVDQNDNVWVAHSIYSSTIGRLKSDGTYLGTIKVAAGPTGIAIDAEGYIWVVCYYGYIQKIDPNKGPLSLNGVTPLGEIIFTSQKIDGLLYNYSDMTGSTLTGAPKAATWTAVYDSEDADTQWGKINWKSEVYNDGSVEVLVSTSTDNIVYFFGFTGRRNVGKIFS